MLPLTIDDSRECLINESNDDPPSSCDEEGLNSDESVNKSMMPKINCFYILPFLFFVAIALYFYFVILPSWVNSSRECLIQNRFKDGPFASMSQMYITANYTNPGRLGNILFRFASLYGIGQTLKRHPYFNGNNALQINAYTEFADAFPLLAEYIDIKIPSEKMIKTVKFGSDLSLSKYEDPKHLKKYNDIKYLTVSANFLHSYKFFHKYQNDIKKLMECSETFKKNAENIAKNVWKNDADSYKLCIHVRREDFVASPIVQETEYNFVVSATAFIYRNLKLKESKISLSIINNDEAFSRSLKFSNLSFTSVNILSKNSAAMDMCFASRYCDSLLISASASTYAWWIGYLMENQSNIFYNSKIAKTKEGEKLFSIDDFFLPHWKKLKFFENGTIIMQSSAAG